MVRNLINAAGYLSFMRGAVRVGRDAVGASFSAAGNCWLFLLGPIIFSTIHVQDIPDQEGDRVRNRRTVPLVIGDGPARWTVATLVVLWAAVCLYFWRARFWIAMALITLSISIARRMIVLRTVEDDKRTFKLWNCWVMFIFSLPLIK